MLFIHKFQLTYVIVIAVAVVTKKIKIKFISTHPKIFLVIGNQLLTHLPNHLVRENTCLSL